MAIANNQKFLNQSSVHKTYNSSNFCLQVCSLKFCACLFLKAFPHQTFALYSIVIANINISVNKLPLPFSIIISYTIGILQYIHHFLEDFSIAILMIVQFVATELQ